MAALAATCLHRRHTVRQIRPDREQSMPIVTRRSTLLGLAAVAAAPARLALGADDVLPSWRDGPARQAILRFAQETTDRSSPHFVPIEERVATFDQDGTLWVEQPMYSQLMTAWIASPQSCRRSRRSPMSNRSGPCCRAITRQWRSYRWTISSRSPGPRSAAWMSTNFAPRWRNGSAPRAISDGSGRTPS